MLIWLSLHKERLGERSSGLFVLCRVGEMVDARDLKSLGVIRTGSSPVSGTIINEVILCYLNHVVAVAILSLTARLTVVPVYLSYRLRERLGSESPGLRVIESITRLEILSI